MRTLGAAMVIFLSMLAPSEVFAQPALLSASGEEQDASLTLTMMDQLITADPNVWCQIEVAVDTRFEDFTEGDTVEVFLIEDDAVFNDTVWEDEHIITAAEAGAGSYEATFDCGAMGSRDGVGDLEFFAQVDVTKATCGLTCFNDNPSTDNLDVEGLSDDEHEEDDAMKQAPDAELGMLGERIAADADFQRVRLDERGSIEAEIDFMAGCGEVEVEIWDEDGNVIAENDPGEDTASAVAEDLDAGVYFVMVAAIDNNDLNFYDVLISTESSPGPETTGGDTDGDETGGSGPDTDDAGESDTASASASDPSASASNGESDANPTASGGDATAGATAGETDTDTDGVDTGGAAEADGCGCRQGSGPGWQLAVLVLGLLAGRRRRVRPSGSAR